MTVSNKRGHRGEREVSRKTIARGMPGETGVTVVTMLVCFFILHARLRVHWAPGIPCALCFLWANGFCKNSGASRREIAEAHLEFTSLRANGSRECAPDDRLREAIHLAA